ncbi:MAG: DUF6511 domain-containing protein, partial [Pseudomonadota bacterium]
DMPPDLATAWQAPLGGQARHSHDLQPPARLALCAVCVRESHGFGYRNHGTHDRHPTYRFCSRRCQIIGVALAKRNNGMIDKTARERQAIRDARTHFAEALAELGLMQPFFHRSGEDIDRLIEAAVTGYSDSMQNQAAQQERTGSHLNDPLPF